MKSSWIGLGLLAGSFAFACGGDDSTNITLPDGGNDVNSAADTSGGNDASKLDGAGNPEGGNPEGGNPEAGTDAGAFTPASVNGLVLWLDAAKDVTQKTLNTARVTLWGDQTSHKNDARGYGVNNPNAFPRNPTVLANGINGLPAIHFDKGLGGQGTHGNWLTIVDNADASLQWGTGDFYVAIIARFDNNEGDGIQRGAATLFTKMPLGTNPVTGVGMYGNIPPATFNGQAGPGLYFQTQSTTNDFVATTTAYNDLNAHQFTFQRVGTKLDMFVDGAVVATSTSAGINVDAKSTLVRIGADLDASILRLNGDIGEMLAVKGVLSAQDQNDLELYLKNKYGL